MDERREEGEGGKEGACKRREGEEWGVGGSRREGLMDEAGLGEERGGERKKERVEVRWRRRTERR